MAIYSLYLDFYSGVLFFFSYFILIGLIMLKLFIAVILQAYNDIKLKDDKVFNDEMLSIFIRCWQDFDPEVRLIYIFT